MESGLRAVSNNNFGSVDWIETVLYLSDRKYIDQRKIQTLVDYFGSLIVAAPGEVPDKTPEQVQWVSYDANTFRADIWNDLLHQTDKSWVLFIEDDEVLHFSSLPSKTALDSRRWPPTLIKKEGQGAHFQYYHMRLIPTEVAEGHRIFSGKNLPDCTAYIRENEVNLLNNPIVLERQSDPVADINVPEELSIQNHAPKLYLVQGKRDFEKKEYVCASAQYRQLLKKKKLLPYDRLAAVNGLASCFAEQHKWEKALLLTQESIEAESLQRLPYLIQFRIYQLHKQWEKALQSLEEYYQRLTLFSRASFDRIMNEEQTLVYLSDIALKVGDRSKANDYLDELFTIKRDAADGALLEKALLLSIELEDLNRSVQLFERLYKGQLPSGGEELKSRKSIDDILTLFMNQGWYDYVSDVYKSFHETYPEDREFKRKFIVTLTKTNRLDQARSMVANMI